MLLAGRRHFAGERGRDRVTDLDRVTQQNAALGKGSAASARAMSDNAGVPGRTLDRFKW